MLRAHARIRFRPSMPAPPNENPNATVRIGHDGLAQARISPSQSRDGEIEQIDQDSCQRGNAQPNDRIGPRFPITASCGPLRVAFPPGTGLVRCPPRARHCDSRQRNAVQRFDAVTADRRDLLAAGPLVFARSVDVDGILTATIVVVPTADLLPATAWTVGTGGLSRLLRRTLTSVYCLSPRSRRVVNGVPPLPAGDARIRAHGQAPAPRS